jgi:hypothetical protein
MSASKKERKYTPAEYLALEENAEYRSEFINGYIFQIAGGTEAHIQISFNMTFFPINYAVNAAPIKAK